MNLGERFWSKVDKTDTCWNWTANRSDSGIGYGQFWLNGKLRPANRLAYEEFFGPIPESKLVCHQCDNRACVNPAHLFFGTHTENMKDMVSKDRRATKVKKPVVKKLLELSKAGLSSAQIAPILGIHPGHVRKIRRRYEAHAALAPSEDKSNG